MSYAIQPDGPKGYTNRERNNHVTSAIFFKKKMDKGSQDNARYNHMMGALAEAEEDPNAAKFYYQNTIVNQPMNSMARSDYALFLADQSKRDPKNSGQGFSQAQDEYRKALIIDEHNPNLRKNYGAMLGRKGTYREALTQTSRALEKNKQDPMIHRNMAKLNNTLGDVHSALHHNMASIRMELRKSNEQKDTKAYRQAAVQIISTGGDRAEAHKLMDAARALERKRFVLPTTERTNQVLLMMLERRGDALGELERENEKKKQEEADKEAAMRTGDVATLLNKVRDAKEAKKKEMEFA